MKAPEPAPLLLLDNLETLKVLADPFRNQILEVLAARPLTVNQIAEKLGVQPSKLYYHVNLLEKHGLIRVVETSVKANIIEKQYWVTAYQYDLGKDLCNFATPIGRESVSTSMVAPIETTREDILRSLQARATALDQGAKAHPRQVLVYRELRQIPDELADRFIERLKEITKEFEAFKDHELSEDVETHALTIAFYPSFYYANSEEAEE